MGFVVAPGAASLAYCCGYHGSSWFAIESALAVLLVTDSRRVEELRGRALTASCKELSNNVGKVDPQAIPLLGKLERVLFQRHGVLTRGRPRVSEVVSLRDNRRPDDILRLAAAAEFSYSHPLQDALLENEDIKKGTIPNVKGFKHIPGEGVRAILQGRELLYGNLDLLKDEGQSPQRAEPGSRGVSFPWHPHGSDG